MLGQFFFAGLSRDNDKLKAMAAMARSDGICVMLAGCAALPIYVKTFQAPRSEKNDRQAVQL